MKFEITVLGCGSATPTLRFSPTSQLVNHNEQYFLLDCGEGTQLQLRRFKVKFQRIDHIFITHLHGDHHLGLPGLLSTFHLLGRTKPMHIYAFAPLREATLLQLTISHSRLRFPLVWHDLDKNGEHVLFENPRLSISSFPLQHQVPCCGFKIMEKPRLRNIRKEIVAQYPLSPARIRQIKAGADLKLESGEILPNHTLTKPAEPPRSYAFCTDTRETPETAKYVLGVSAMYHESTFLETETKRAKDTFHSTASGAARVAHQAQVGQLILGHYSARYRQQEPFLAEAKSIFPNSLLAYEGMVIPLV